MVTFTESLQRYYGRDRIRFWLFLASMALLIGQLLCSVIILVEEILLISSINENQYSMDQLIACQFYTFQETNSTEWMDSNKSLQATLLAQLASHAVANLQLVLVSGMAVRSVHIERGFQTSVRHIFPFSWTWTFCVTVLAWPYLPIIASMSTVLLECCHLALFLAVVGLSNVIGAAIIYTLAYIGWKRHEIKLMKLVEKRQNNLANSTDDMSWRYRSAVTLDMDPDGHGHLPISYRRSSHQAQRAHTNPNYLSTSFSPHLAEATLNNAMG